MSEKTHPPTPEKLREARAKGQLPRSKLFTSAAVTLGGLTGTLAFLGETQRRLRAWTTSLLGLTTRPGAAVDEGVALLARCAAPTLAGALLAAMAVQLALAGFQVRAELALPKLDRLDFIQGAKKLLSVARLLEVLKGLGVTVALGILAWRRLLEAGPTAFRVLGTDGAWGVAALLHLWGGLVRDGCVGLLAFGLFDQWLARRKHLKDLMMSSEEVKEAHKRAEGDPRHKSKRKALHKQLASGGSARGVTKATVVVVNPTHVAVALRYDPSECDAPYIVAKGREEDALALRRAAQTQSIPVVRDVPLARAMVQYDVGEAIPEELYQAAAAVLKVAWEASERRGAPAETEREGETGGEGEDAKR